MKTPSLLVIGVGDGEGNGGRSDQTAIVAVINNGDRYAGELGFPKELTDRTRHANKVTDLDIDSRAVAVKDEQAFRSGVVTISASVSFFLKQRSH